MSHWLYVILRRHGVPPVDSRAPFTVREGRRFPANHRAGSAGSSVGSARQQTRRNDPRSRSRSRSRQTTQPPDVGEKIGKTERRVNKPTGTPLWSCNVRHHKTLAVLNPLNSDDSVSFYLLTSDSNAKLYVCIYIYMNLQMYLCTHTHTHVRAKHFLSFPQFFPISCSCFVSVVPILQQPPW